MLVRLQHDWHVKMHILNNYFTLKCLTTHEPNQNDTGQQLYNENEILRMTN